MARETERPGVGAEAKRGRWLAAALAVLLVGGCGPSAAGTPPASSSAARPAAEAPAAQPAAQSAAQPAAQAAAPAAAQPAARNEPPLQPQSVVVRMDWIPWATHAPMHLAVERGWFTERGLEVDLQNGTGSVATVQAVGAGRFDLGFASLATMALAREEALPVRGVAGIVRKSDLGFMYGVETGIRTPKDLEGKSLVTSPGSLEQPFLVPFLSKNGADPDRVTILALDPAAKLSTFMAGRGDVFVAPVPHQFTRLNKQKPIGAFTFAEYGLLLPGHGLFATEETIQAKPALMRAMVEVTLRAWDYAREHPEEAMRAMYSQRSNADLPDFEGELAALERYRDFLDTERTRGQSLGWQSEEDWADSLRAMTDAGLVKPGARPADYFTNQFIPTKS